MIDMGAYAAMYVERVNVFRKKHPEFDELVKNSPCYIGQEAQIAIMGLDNSAEVVYFLALNHDFANALGKMHPIFALVEIGKLSAKLLNE